MNRFAWIVAFVLVAGAAGCKQPMRVNTHMTGHIHGNAKVNADVNANVDANVKAKVQAEVKADPPPIRDTTPLLEMVVEPGDGAAQVALIDVDGLLLNHNPVGSYSLGENPVETFREKLDAVARNPCFRAVVLRINSSGGAVTATDIMWRELRAFKIRTGLPVVACFMDVGTGGAYYLACGADHIVAHPTTITGGLGVILNLYQMTEAASKFGSDHDPIRAGQFVDLGSPGQKLTDEGAEILENIAKEHHQRLRNVVARARPQAKLDKDVVDGRVFTAARAVELKLVDEIGYVHDACEAARKLGGCPNAQVVMLHRAKDEARTPYAVSPNTPIQQAFSLIQLPGAIRAQLPLFLYIWQPEPMIEAIQSR